MEKVIFIKLIILFLDCPYWLAPEIILKEKEITAAVDIWSLGCIIIEMATKNPPWSNLAKTPKEVIELIAKSTGK
jgi:serine/threonine protein kinase